MEKLLLPFFDGVKDDPELWLESMEEYFEYSQISMDRYVTVAIRYLRGVAAVWARDNYSVISKDWCAFSYNLLWKFNPSSRIPEAEELVFVGSNNPTDVIACASTGEDLAPGVGIGEDIGTLNDNEEEDKAEIDEHFDDYPLTVHIASTGKFHSFETTPCITQWSYDDDTCCFIFEEEHNHRSVETSLLRYGQKGQARKLYEEMLHRGRHFGELYVGKGKQLLVGTRFTSEVLVTAIRIGSLPMTLATSLPMATDAIISFRSNGGVQKRVRGSNSLSNLLAEQCLRLIVHFVHDSLLSWTIDPGGIVIECLTLVSGLWFFRAFYAGQPPNISIRMNLGIVGKAFDAWVEAVEAGTSTSKGENLYVLSSNAYMNMSSEARRFLQCVNYLCWLCEQERSFHAMEVSSIVSLASLLFTTVPECSSIINMNHKLHEWGTVLHGPYSISSDTKVKFSQHREVFTWLFAVSDSSSYEQSNHFPWYGGFGHTQDPSEDILQNRLHWLLYLSGMHMLWPPMVPDSIISSIIHRWESYENMSWKLISVVILVYSGSHTKRVQADVMELFYGQKIAGMQKYYDGLDSSSGQQFGSFVLVSSQVGYCSIVEVGWTCKIPAPRLACSFNLGIQVIRTQVGYVALFFLVTLLFELQVDSGMLRKLGELYGCVVLLQSCTFMEASIKIYILSKTNFFVQILYELWRLVFKGLVLLPPPAQLIWCRTVPLLLYRGYMIAGLCLFVSLQGIVVVLWIIAWYHYTTSPSTIRSRIVALVMGSSLLVCALGGRRSNNMLGCPFNPTRQYVVEMEIHVSSNNVFNLRGTAQKTPQSRANPVAGYQGLSYPTQLLAFLFHQNSSYMKTDFCRAGKVTIWCYDPGIYTFRRVLLYGLYNIQLVGRHITMVGTSSRVPLLERTVAEGFSLYNLEVRAVNFISNTLHSTMSVVDNCSSDPYIMHRVCMPESTDITLGQIHSSKIKLVLVEDPSSIGCVLGKDRLSVKGSYIAYSMQHLGLKFLSINKEQMILVLGSDMQSRGPTKQNVLIFDPGVHLLNYYSVGMMLLNIVINMVLNIVSILSAGAGSY